MDRRYSIYGIIKDLIAQETRYMRIYDGQVFDVADPLSKGRVHVTIPALGWMTPNEGPWCDPEYISGGLVVPTVGTWVKIWFLGGDPARPIYGPKLGHVKDSKPSVYADQTTEVIMADELSGFALAVNATDGTFDAKNAAASLAGTLDGLLGHLSELVTHLSALTTIGASPPYVLDPGTITNLTTDGANIAADRTQLALILKER